jgi:putative tryptophan/tyrosine transport system substrate-binding protein
MSSDFEAVGATAMRIVTALVPALWFLTVALPGNAEQTAKIYRLGFLMGMDRQPAWTAAFEQGLEAYGWAPGRNVVIEYRSAEGDFDRLPKICSELVSHGVDLILAVSAPETAAAKQCTKTTPIVFAIHGDPVGTGDVESLAHPGGNATGMSQTQGDLVSKLLSLLKEAVPALSRVAVLWNSAVKSKQHDWQEATAAAPKLGVALDSYAVQGPADFDGAFIAISQHRPDALLLFGDPMVVKYRTSITEFAARARLPAMYPQRQFVDAGGLMSCSADLIELFRLSARIVDKILKGANPADIPVEQPTKFEFIINIKAANALGITLPPNLLSLADEVIE